MKRLGLVAAVLAVFGFGLIGDVMAAGPTTSTAVLIVDVGSGASIGMGPGGMGGSIMTGGGPVYGYDGVTPFGVAMHNTMTATMQGMMGGQTIQQRMMSFELDGSATVFVMMAGGSPWTGGQGIILGGTGWAQGISGTFTVGDQAGPTRYHFTFTYSFP